MEVASSRPDYLPTLSADKTSKLSLLVKHHILAIDEAMKQQQPKTRTKSRRRNAQRSKQTDKKTGGG